MSSNCLVERLKIIDNFLDENELNYWKEKVKTGKESTALQENEFKDTVLYKKCRELVGDLPLIHLLLFNVTKGNHTELHKDIGEYACLFYPYSHPTASLTLRDSEIEVKENRLVLLNCTEVEHMQKKPDDDSIRYSIALKWRLL